MAIRHSFYVFCMIFFIFIFGLIIGSFLNVLILRLPGNKSILGFSECPKCKKRIVWYDNIPLLSFLVLKGRCRGCKAAISFQYPLVELLTGILFLISLFIYRNAPVLLIYILFLISLLVTIAFIDLKHFVILDSLIIAGFIVSLCYSLFNIRYWSTSFYDSFFGMLFFAGIFTFLFLISKGKWIGFGDVKMALWLGFTFGLKDAVDIFYLTFLIGFIFVIILLGFKKADLKTKIPLGTLMAGASILFLLSNFSILDLIGIGLILRL